MLSLKPLPRKVAASKKLPFTRSLAPAISQMRSTLLEQQTLTLELFINENLVESLPGKRKELYGIASELVADGVPIDGVALQMDITEVPVEPGVTTEIVDSYKALGLEVTIAEMDVHTLNAALQTQIYGDVIDEALHAGITDISFWGFTDKHAYTWVPGAKLLMFDENYNAKGPFYATDAALKDFVSGWQGA